MTNIHYGESPPGILHYLQGIEFPVSREQLIAYGKSQNASPEVMEYLENLPDQEYTAIADVAPDVFEGEF